MSAKVEHLEHNMVKLTVEVPAEEFLKAITRAYNKEKKRITIPGFRKGHAPQHLIEKMYGAAIFFEDAVNDCINSTYPSEAEGTGLTFVSRPEFDVEQMEKGLNLIYTSTVAVRPEVKLGEYRGIEVKKAELEVTDEDIAKKIDAERDKNARLVEVEDRAAEMGDTVTFDYAGRVDGELFEGGSAENHELVLGSGQFIPGFEEQLVGMKIDENKDLTVTFPEQYHAEDLAGKEAVFNCTLHRIQKKELPELDDEFAQDVSDFDTLEEYRNSVREELLEEKERRAKEEKEDEAIEKLVDASEMDIPDAMVNFELDRNFEDQARQFASQGLSMELYLQYSGMTEQQLKEQMRPQILRQIRTRLVLEDVAKDAGIEISEERLDEEIGKMAERYSMEKDKLKDLMGDAEKKQIREDLAVQEAITLIADNAKEV